MSEKEEPVEFFDDVGMESIEQLIPYHNNPKRHPEDQIDKIASSIKEYGFTVPVLVAGDGEIIAGHGRVKAAKKLGLEEVPVIRRDDLSEAQIKAFRIMDNKAAESGWDYEKLDAEVERLEEMEVDVPGMTGLDDVELSDFDEDLDIDSHFETDETQDDDSESEEEGDVECPNCGHEFTP